MKHKNIALQVITAASVLLLAGCCDAVKEKKEVKEAVEASANEVRASKEPRSSGANGWKKSTEVTRTVQQEGTGASPKAGRTVLVHYTGWLADKNGQPGAKFDSSVDRGQPFSFMIGVGQVIQGWDEGVMQMKVGEKSRLYIPSAKGYGAQGAGASIPPHADLIFDVELLKVS